jgi:PAS domain S-box-containing protein
MLLMLRLAGGILLLYLTTGGTTPLDAQERAITQLQIRSWTEEDGLPVNAIVEARQTPDGYMWFGTESGLVRFDGSQFITVGPPESPLYTSSDIIALAVGAGDDLWIGTTTGLIRRDRSGTFRWDAEPQELASAYVTDIHTGSDGRLWVATTGEGIFLITDDTIGKKIPTRGFEPGSIRDISPSRGGLPWVATDDGLARVGRDTVLIHVAGSDSSHDARAVLEDRRGRVWLGTRDGLFRLEDGQLVQATESGPLRNTLIRDIEEDRDGNLWVATSGAGLFRLTGNRWEQLSVEHGLPSDDLHVLAIDDRGDLWVGTGAGLALVYEGDVLPITPAEGLSSAVTLPIMEDRGGRLWVGTFNGGVTRIDGDETTVLGVADGLPHDVVLSLAEDATGRVWIGTRGGIAIFDRDRVTGPPPGVPSSESVLALLYGRRGMMWVGTTNGVYAIGDGNVRFFGPAEGLVNPWVLSLYEARDGSLLVGTQGGGAYTIRGTRVYPVASAAGSDASVVISFHEMEDGTLWMGTATGLLRVGHGERVLLGRAEGLPDLVANRILSDGRGELWIGSNRGVYRVSIAQLDSVADGTRARISPRLFTERDGMPASETNGGFHPAGWRGRTGQLFFPTMEGVAVFDPALIASKAVALRVVIEGIDAASADAETPRGTDLPPDVSDLSISYTALDFRDGDRAEFQYRLTGYDTAWVYAGERRTAYYTRLPPGQYSFAVQARLPGQAWQTADPLSFRLRPHFYETYWFRVTAVLLAILLVLGLHRWRVNILRKREMELLELVRARESAEQRYREIFENAREMVVILDAESRITEANGEACRTLGRELKALIGVSLDSLAVDGEAAEGGPGPLARIAAEQRLLKLTLFRPDGSAVQVEASVRELTEDGQSIGFQLIGRDTTERHVLEDRLRHSQRMEAVGLLAGGVAHDFNNILSVISGYATLALQGLEPSDPLREDVLEISEAAGRAATLTHQLLAFSRNQTLQPRIIQLNDVVVGMEKLLRRLIGDDIEFAVDVARDLWHVMADPGQMEQVITNLAVNSRDAMPMGGHLRIETRNRVLTPSSHGHGEIVPGEYVVLSVTDTGSGITSEVRERIFDPFFTTKATGTGTGLGLATVHGIVKQSGGHVGVKSTVGEGSTFEIFLPRDRGTPAPSREPAPDPKPGQGHETVLVVDDEESVRRLVCRVLERSGYRVIEAASPMDALTESSAASARSIDLLLTDVVMPQMSGPDLAERMRESYPALKIIFMSGYTDEKLASRVITHTLLRKPFGPTDLLSKVREVLEA